MAYIALPNSVAGDSSRFVRSYGGLTNGRATDASYRSVPRIGKSDIPLLARRAWPTPSGPARPSVGQIWPHGGND